MKHEITKEGVSFKPIKITLTIETEEELKEFKEAVGSYDCFSWNLYEDLKDY